MNPQIALGTGRAEAERKIGAAWREVLGAQAISLDDNIFNLGGTSLHVVQAYAKLRDTLGVPLTVLDLFSHPTIRSLADHLFPNEEAQPVQSFRPAANRAALQWQAARAASLKSKGGAAK